MLLYLINPSNPLVSLSDGSRWNRYRVWKPLGLLVLAGLTPPGWEIRIIDENLGRPDYATMQRPDLVGLTAFTSQASRAYALADEYRALGVPVIMGGIHATMCTDEALEHVDAVVAGEAESVWARVLADWQVGALQQTYHGDLLDMAGVPPARNDLLQDGYAFGSVQTTRGCPLNCSFCSVSAFNGKQYRYRPIQHVIDELKTIREKRVLIVDDNLIGVSAKQLERAKDLFRAIIASGVRKQWVGQVTINFADDDELLTLARRAGCQGVFIGFESPTQEGLAEIGKKFNSRNARDFRASVRRIQRHGMLVVGSFILGLDADQPGIGALTARTARSYGVDLLNALFLTPLPGTRLWKQMREQKRILAADFPEDWKYYTLSYPTARYAHFSSAEIVKEMESCERRFYSGWQIVGRIVSNLLAWRRPLLSLVSNLSYRANSRSTHRRYRRWKLADGAGLPKSVPQPIAS